MSFLRRLFLKSGKSEKMEDSTAVFNQIHISRIEQYSESTKYLHFNFPNFENDLFSIEIFEDEFSNKIIIKPRTIHSYIMDKVMFFSDRHVEFNIGLLSNQLNHFISIAAFQKDIKISSGDKLLLLFETEEILEIPITKKGYRLEKDSYGVLLEGKEEIEYEIILKLSNQFLKKWKYIDVVSGIEHTNYFNDEKKRNIKEMAQMMVIAIASIQST